MFIRLQKAKGLLHGKRGSRRNKAGRPENFSDPAVQRRLNRTTKLVGVALCKAEMQENKIRVSRSGKTMHTNPQPSKPCGGFAIYKPACGPAITSATSKLNEGIKAKGCLKRILRIAEEKNFATDGGRNDPSIVTLLQHIVAELIGERTEQGEYIVESGKTPCADRHVRY